MTSYELDYSKLVNRLRATRRKESSIMLMSASLKVLGIAFITVLLASLIEMAANGDELFRSVVFILSCFTVLVSSAYYLGPFFSRIFGKKHSYTVEQIALRVGGVFPEIKDKLCNSIQLVKNLNSSGSTSSDLSLAAFSEINSETEGLDFDRIIEKSTFRRSLIFSFFAIIFTGLLFIIFSSSLGSAFYRVANFNQSFLPPAPFSISIEPLSRSILRGEPAEIIVRAEGRAPETLSLMLKEKQQEEYDEYTLRLDSGNIYSYTIPSLKQTIEFYAKANWLSSEIVTRVGYIKVTDKPIIRSLTGRIRYPAYTRLAPKDFIDNNADISALKGSRVSFNLLANKELDSAWLVVEKSGAQGFGIQDSSVSQSDTSRRLMKTDGRKANGAFTVSASGSYYFIIRDNEGEYNEDPIKYAIIAHNDEYPVISLLEPTTNVQVSEEALLPVRVAISDDYGFSSLKLKYRLIASRYTSPDKKFSSVDIALYPGENIAELPFLWDLNDVNIAPEDKYEFFLEVFDNDVVSGPKSSRTKTLTVRLPSLEEVLASADDAQKEVEKDLKKILKDAKEASKEMNELNRELLKNYQKKELNWKEKKKFEDIMKKQAELKEKVSDIKNKLEDMSQKLQQNNALTPETIEKFKELQKLLSEVESPVLKKLQDRYQKNMKDISPEQLRQAMKEMKFDEEKFRKSIERTLKLLKRLQAEQKTEAIQKMAEDLKNRQDELSKETENSNSSDKKKQDEIAAKQKAIQEDMQDMLNEMDELENLMKEVGEDMPTDMLKDAEEQLNPEETSQEMQNSQQQAQQGDFNKSKKSQKKASSNLSKFAQAMQKMKEQMEDQNTKEAIRKMQKAASDMLKLSKEQENLKNKTGNADYNSTQVPDYAKQQAGMYESLANVANGLMALADKSFAVTPQMGQKIGDAMQSMQQSMQQLSDRRTANSAKSQGSAMSSMNQAISEMQDMISALKNQGSGQCDNPGGQGQGDNPGSGMGFGEQLQKMAQQQQAMNQAAQQMGQQPGGSMSMEQRAEYGRIAKEQGKAMKSLQELAKEQKEFGGGDRKTLGDLEKIAKEMKEVVTDLEQGNITDETRKRQDRILSRLLDATRSIHDRDYQKKRESKTGKEYLTNNPDDIDLTTQEGKTRALQELLKSIKQGYTKDYEALIQKYFDALQESQIEQ